MLNSQQVLDRYYPEVRAWLIQIAAVMDRYDRARAAEGEADGGGDGGADPRLEHYRAALKVLASDEATADRARQIQMIYSEPAGPPAESRS